VKRKDQDRETFGPQKEHAAIGLFRGVSFQQKGKGTLGLSEQKTSQNVWGGKVTVKKTEPKSSALDRRPKRSSGEGKEREGLAGGEEGPI